MVLWTQTQQIKLFIGTAVCFCSLNIITSIVQSCFDQIPFAAAQWSALCLIQAACVGTIKARSDAESEVHNWQRRLDARTQAVLQEWQCWLDASEQACLEGMLTSSIRSRQHHRASLTRM